MQSLQSQFAELGGLLSQLCQSAADGPGAERALGMRFEDLAYAVQRALAGRSAEDGPPAPEELARGIEAVLGDIVEGLLIFDAAGRLAHCNTAARRLAGCTGSPGPADPLLRQPAGCTQLCDLSGNPLPPEQWPSARVLAGETLSGLELRIRNQDRCDEWIGRVNALPVRDGGGRITRAVVTVHDVSGQKRAAAARQQAEERIAAVQRELERQVAEQGILLQLLPVGVGISHDPWCRDIRVNPAFAEMHGIPVEGNASLSTAVDPAGYRLFRDGQELAPGELPMQIAAAHGVEVREAELDLLRADGRMLHLLEYALPLFDEQGRPRGSIGVSLDITERKQIENTLRRSHDELEARVQERTAELMAANQELAQSAVAARYQTQLLNSLMNHSPDCIYVKDADSRFITTNAVHLRIMGRQTLAEVIGKTDLELFPGPLGQGYYADEQEILRTGEPLLNREEQVVDAHGQAYWFLSSKVPLHDEEGQIIGLVGVSRDITKRKRAELALQASQEQHQALARRLVEAVEEERRSMARELHDEAGQALTALQMRLERLRRLAGSEPETVAPQIEELKQLVSGVMEDLHRMAMQLRPASLDRLGLAPALAQYCESLREQTGLLIDFVALDLEEERLPLTVETALYRVVQEALANVVRHAQAARAGVVIQRQGPAALAIIEDDGIGFDVEAALSFGRLGLLGMRERVEMLGGELTIESILGHGTTVFASVPLPEPATAG